MDYDSPDDAVGTLEGRFAGVAPLVLLEVWGVAELAAAVWAREPGLVRVDEQMIVETVLSSEHTSAEMTLVRLYACNNIQKWH